MPIPEEVLTSLSVDNVKNVAGAGAFYAAARMSDHSAHQKRMDQIAEDSARLSSLLHGRLARSVAEPDPTESVAVNKMLTGNDLANTMSALGTAVAQIQQLMKGAQTTPPVTAP